MGAVQIPTEGRPPIAFDSYLGFLQTMLGAQMYTWFAKIVAASELLSRIVHNLTTKTRRVIFYPIDTQSFEPYGPCFAQFISENNIKKLPCHWGVLDWLVG